MKVAHPKPNNKEKQMKVKEDLKTAAAAIPDRLRPVDQWFTETDYLCDTVLCGTTQSTETWTLTPADTPRLTLGKVGATGHIEQVDIALWDGKWFIESLIDTTVRQVTGPQADALTSVYEHLTINEYIADHPYFTHKPAALTETAAA